MRRRNIYFKLFDISHFMSFFLPANQYPCSIGGIIWYLNSQSTSIIFLVTYRFSLSAFVSKLYSAGTLYALEKRINFRAR